MSENFDKYLLDNGERITNLDQLTPGEIYAMGCGKEGGFKAFEMPYSNQKIIRNNGLLILRGVRVCTKVSAEDDKPEGTIETIQLDDLIHINLTGVIKPNPDSEIMRIAHPFFNNGSHKSH